MKRIASRKDLIELAQRLGVRKDWHEPEEQEVTAVVLKMKHKRIILLSPRVEVEYFTRQLGHRVSSPRGVLTRVFTAHGKTYGEIKIDPELKGA